MRTNRRKFIGTAAAAGAAALASKARADEPKKLSLGLIGAGWYGNVDAQAALKAGGAEIAAVCDVDSAHLKKSADDYEKAQGKRPQTFKLYQELLDSKGLDGVIIATPPHWHALISIAAMQAGKDVLCEKPMTRFIAEGKGVIEAERRYGRIFQIGTYGRLGASHNRDANTTRKIMLSGLLKECKGVHIHDGGW